jgi:Uma2 family endonuclease
MSAVNQRPTVMAMAEFLAWNPPRGDRWELVDGSPRAMAPSSPRHGAIQAEVARLIGNRLGRVCKRLTFRI